MSRDPVELHLQLKADGNKLRLPAGVLTLVGVGTSVTFARNVELIVAFE